MKSKLLFLMIGIILLIGIGSVSATILTSGTKTYQDIGGLNYTTITFTSNGTLNITGETINMSILLIAGGGGGGAGQYIGAGGGAGGLIYNNSFDVTTGNYNIVVGKGGEGGVVTTTSYSGQNSSAFGKIATGGGRAGQRDTAGDSNGGNGGSGGGATDGGSDLGGSGIAGQGNDGGNYNLCSAGSGGGGAGSVGTACSGTTAGNGGTGLSYSINGTATCYAGGGGGASQSGVQGVGTCGGGSGTTSNGGNGINGTGGGGGGAERNGGATGGRGGDGVIVIRYILIPIISVDKTYPSNNSLLTQSNLFNVSLDISGEEKGFEWANNTYYIWFSNGTTRNTTTITGLSTKVTSTSKLFILGFGNYLWNSYACYNNATFGNCSWSNNGNFSFHINSTINSETHNNLTYETITSEVYTLNISSPVVPTNAFLVYNGTSYSATITSSGGNYLLSKTLQINSTMIGLNSFYYKWNLSSTYAENTSVYNQTISPIQFGLCNGTLTIPYMNFTFKDEGSLNFIKASIPSSTFIYYLGDGTVNKTLTFVNTTANLNYTFCALPSNLTYNIKTNIQYKNDTNYPQRIFDEVVKAFTNATTNKTLYLLDSAQGIYVTYQVLDAIGNQLDNVQVNVNRTIEGLPYNVGNGLTDSAGSITFWLNPDFIHSLSFSKSGYETFSLAQFPTQSAYTITLGTSTGLGINDYIRGITYTFLPNSGELLNASQLYNFNLTFNSTYWTLDSFGFILYGDGTVIGGNYSTSSSGGYLENVLNVSSYTHISIKIYWIINGTTTYGINDGNYVFVYEGTEWSIFNFFTDLKRYMIPTYHPETNSYTGIFGLNPNSLNLIIFVIIFLATGLVSYKFSLTSPAIVTGMIFGLVFLFDVGLGLISVPVGAVKHFPTIFMLLITVALAIWEMRR